MNRTTLSDWLFYLEHQHPSQIELGLERMLSVMAKFQLRKFSCPVIKVAGTNGKGSVTAFLKNFYIYQGYQVGVYTSPHLRRYNERIQINHKEIDDEHLIQIFNEIEHIKGNIRLTYFEYGTLAAFLYFLRHPLDIIILEIGMGGRLDAVNTVVSDLSIITNIELDHCEWLGHTKEAIAYEKAGIIDKNAIVVCGDPHPPPIIESFASQQKAIFYSFSKDYYYEFHDKYWNFISSNISYSHLPHPKLSHHNASIALMAANVLSKQIPLTLESIKRGIKHTHLNGRQQKINYKGREIWLDVAHNPNGIESLVQRIKNHYSQDSDLLNQKTKIIFGMLQDKDHLTCIQLLSELSQTWFLTDLPTPRSTKSFHLKALICKIQQNAAINLYKNVIDAFKDAFFSSKKNDIILICGSFFMVSEIIDFFQN